MLKFLRTDILNTRWAMGEKLTENDEGILRNLANQVNKSSIKRDNKTNEICQHFKKIFKIFQHGTKDIKMECLKCFSIFSLKLMVHYPNEVLLAYFNCVNEVSDLECCKYLALSFYIQFSKLFPVFYLKLNKNIFNEELTNVISGDNLIGLFSRCDTEFSGLMPKLVSECKIFGESWNRRLLIMLIHNLKNCKDNIESIKVVINNFPRLFTTFLDLKGFIPVVSVIVKDVDVDISLIQDYIKSLEVTKFNKEKLRCLLSIISFYPNEVEVKGDIVSITVGNAKVDLELSKVLNNPVFYRLNIPIDMLGINEGDSPLVVKNKALCMVKYHIEDASVLGKIPGILKEDNDQYNKIIFGVLTDMVRNFHKFADEDSSFTFNFVNLIQQIIFTTESGNMKLEVLNIIYAIDVSNYCIFFGNHIKKLLDMIWECCSYTDEKIRELAIEVFSNIVGSSNNNSLLDYILHRVDYFDEKNLTWFVDTFSHVLSRVTVHKDFVQTFFSMIRELNYMSSSYLYISMLRLVSNLPKDFISLANPEGIFRDSLRVVLSFYKYLTGEVLIKRVDDIFIDEVFQQDFDYSKTSYETIFPVLEVSLRFIFNMSEYLRFKFYNEIIMAFYPIFPSLVNDFIIQNYEILNKDLMNVIFNKYLETPYLLNLQTILSACKLSQRCDFGKVKLKKLVKATLTYLEHIPDSDFLYLVDFCGVNNVGEKQARKYKLLSNNIKGNEDADSRKVVFKNWMNFEKWRIITGSIPYGSVTHPHNFYIPEFYIDKYFTSLSSSKRKGCARKILVNKFTPTIASADVDFYMKVLLRKKTLTSKEIFDLCRVISLVPSADMSSLFSKIAEKISSPRDFMSFIRLMRVYMNDFVDTSEKNVDVVIDSFNSLYTRYNDITEEMDLFIFLMNYQTRSKGDIGRFTFTFKNNSFLYKFYFDILNHFEKMDILPFLVYYKKGWVLKGADMSTELTVNPSFALKFMRYLLYITENFELNDKIKEYLMDASHEIINNFDVYMAFFGHEVFFHNTIRKLMSIHPSLFLSKIDCFNNLSGPDLESMCTTIEELFYHVQFNTDTYSDSLILLHKLRSVPMSNVLHMCYIRSLINLHKNNSGNDTMQSVFSEQQEFLSVCEKNLSYYTIEQVSLFLLFINQNLDFDTALIFCLKVLTNVLPFHCMFFALRRFTKEMRPNEKKIIPEDLLRDVLDVIHVKANAAALCLLNEGLAIDKALQLSLITKDYSESDIVSDKILKQFMPKTKS